MRTGAERINRRVVEAALAAACSAAVIVGRNVLPGLTAPALAAGGAMLAIDLARREHRAPTSARPFAWMIAALFVVGVASPPHVPNDIRSYAADGRMVTQYHLSPYLVRPGELAPDPAFAHVRDAVAPYGPLFIGAAAATSLITRHSPVPERVFYQAGAALAIAAALLLLWRTRRSTAALVLVGLHPAVAAIIVNGGHNDAFVGLALLAAVVAAERKRFAGSGAIVAAAMLVKITAGLALVPIAVWAFTRRGRRAAGAALLPTALVVVPATFAIPGLFRAMRASDLGIVTRTSLWNLDPFRAPLIARLGDGAVTQLGLVAVAAAVLVVSIRRGPPATRVVAAVAAWLVLSPYVMPWYTVWGLPLAARDPGRPLNRVVAWQGALVTTAFVFPRHLLSNRFVSFPFGWIGPIALLFAFVRGVRLEAAKPSVHTPSRRPVSSPASDLGAS